MLIPVERVKYSVETLASGWYVRQTDLSDGEWITVKSVPTNVHLDLIAAGKIPDPFIGFNELKVDWVGEKSWTYRVALPPLRLPKSHSTVLAFDGLDTFATVCVNGKVVLKSDNMFVPHRVNIDDCLQTDSRRGENIFEIEFDSALVRARQIKDACPKHKWICYNGEPARMAVRKAQYHWGWDWGPIIMTCGPWKEIRLESYQCKIADLWTDIQLSEDLKTAEIKAHVEVEGLGSLPVKVALEHEGKIVGEAITKTASDHLAHVEFKVDEPALWFPHGHGKQPLYKVTAVLGDSLHTISKRIGIRHVELVQEPDIHGKSFYFRVNNVPVFCGGSNWIPGDSFTPRISAAKYRRWLELMVDGNQCMIRLWGGGIWEPDVLFNICDELGIMVWQDFLFGCGNYPTFPSFLKSVEAEAEAQIKRLRHHPAMVIFAGNNEDYQVQEQSGLTYDFADKDPQSWLKTDFPARYIYEHLLPAAMAKFAPHIQYHPGSPWGDGKPTSDPTVGDMHQWNVWHGTQEKYQIFDSLGGRFNSEFGMEAFPHIDTIRHFVTQDSELYPQSHTLDFHNKAAGHERRLATYLVENFRTRTDLEGFIHLTQMVQAEALMFAYRGWRKQWGDRRKCGGALVWQLNDCWPGTSWAVCDYFLRKKPAYYAMARALAPLAVGVRRSHDDWSVAHARPPKTSDWECWVASSLHESVLATVECRFISVSSGMEIKPTIVHADVRIAANGTTEIARGVLDNSREEPHVLATRLWVDGKVMARDMDWPQPLKYLEMEDRGVKVEFDGERDVRDAREVRDVKEVGEVRVSVQRPTKALVFEEREGVLLSDSALDLVPGDEQVVTVKHLVRGERTLGFRYYGSP